MDAPVQIRAHAGRLRGSVTETLAQVLTPVLAEAPRARPVVVLAVDDLPALTAGTIRQVTRTGRRLAGVSEETVSLRAPRGERLAVPASWIGNTLILVAGIRDPGSATRDALAHLARGLGARERTAARAGAWLGAHVFSAVVVVLEGAGRITASALPHRSAAAAALDAWLARRIGRRLPMPPGFTVRGFGDRGRWGRDARLGRPLSLAAKRRERP